MNVTTDLHKTAYALGAEIHNGKWSHVQCLHSKPAPACAEITDELRRRCPGYTLQEYQDALARGLHESMF